MKNRINKQQLVVEFVSVVFAVILALILNNWRETASLNNDLSRVEESIRKEVVRNDSLVQESHQYRQDLLEKFYTNNHQLISVPASALPFDVNDNEALASYFELQLIIGQKEFFERVKVMQDGENRVLILNENVFDLVVESDTLKLKGIGNIQLRIPNLSNRSWDLAQATGTIVNMDVTMVEKLIIVNALLESYESTSESAIQMVYSGNQRGLLSVLEDLFNIEAQIIEANAALLSDHD